MVTYTESSFSIYTYIALGIGIVVALVAVFAIYVATRPNEFVITRSAVMPAPPDQVFAVVNDFHEWDHWSPWAKLDPNCKTTFEGPATGVGAKFAWDGNSKVGAGSMAIIESQPNDSIKIDLTFTRPMQGTNLTVFTFKPEAGGTRVTWTMSGSNGFMGKLFGVFVDCDKMVGGQFDEGLENMKNVLKSKGKT